MDEHFNEVTAVLVLALSTTVLVNERTLQQ